MCSTKKSYLYIPLLQVGVLKQIETKQKQTKTNKQNKTKTKQQQQNW